MIVGKSGKVLSNWIGNHTVKSKKNQSFKFEHLKHSLSPKWYIIHNSNFILGHFSRWAFNAICITILYSMTKLYKELKPLNNFHRRSTQWSSKVISEINERVETLSVAVLSVPGSIRPTDKRCLFLHATLVWSFSNPRPPPFLCCLLSSATRSFLPPYTKNLVLKVRLSCLSLLWL